jgi:hypothetical protein
MGKIHIKSTESAAVKLMAFILQMIKTIFNVTYEMMISQKVE